MQAHKADLVRPVSGCGQGRIHFWYRFDGVWGSEWASDLGVMGMHLY